MTDESEIPSKQAFSQAALPVINPLASRMRVTTVASRVGVQERAEVPFVQGIVASAMLSFSAMVRPLSWVEVGLVLLTVTCRCQLVM